MCGKWEHSQMLQDITHIVRETEIMAEGVNEEGQVISSHV